MIFRRRNWQRCSSKNETGGNLSFPQILSVFAILLLTFVIVSGCDARSSPNQSHAQSSGTPLPTIAARDPGSEQAFCNGSVDPSSWSGPKNGRQIDSEVPPSVPSDLIGGYSV